MNTIQIVAADLPYGDRFAVGQILAARKVFRGYVLCDAGGEAFLYDDEVIVLR